MRVHYIYIFKNKEDRRNEEMYKKLAEMVCRTDGFTSPQNIARAKKSDRYYDFYAEDSSEHANAVPLFETHKNDLFLWMEGETPIDDLSYLYEIAETDEERTLIDNVLPGYTTHYEEGFWFEELPLEVESKIFGKSTELMRRLEDKEKYKDLENDNHYYFIQREDGQCYIVSDSQLPELYDFYDFYNRFFVSCEIIAPDKETAARRLQNRMVRPVMQVDGINEKIGKADYYLYLFQYFRRLQKTTKSLPANFWEWLDSYPEEKLLNAALLYAKYNLVMYEMDKTC